MKAGHKRVSGRKSDSNIESRDLRLLVDRLRLSRDSVSKPIGGLRQETNVNADFRRRIAVSHHDMLLRPPYINSVCMPEAFKHTSSRSVGSYW